MPVIMCKSLPTFSEIIHNYSLFHSLKPYIPNIDIYNDILYTYIQNSYVYIRPKIHYKIGVNFLHVQDINDKT